MAAWICMACGAYGEGSVDTCPQCRHVDHTRWLCCECWTEGVGERPRECPTCGYEDSWFQAAPKPGDHRTMKVIFEEVMAGIFGPPPSRH